MSYVAKFTIPPDEFPFGATLKNIPDITIEVDQIIPTDESAFPFFWVHGCDPEEFMRVTEAEPKVEAIRLLEKVSQTGLFRAEWRPNAEVIQGLKELDVTIIESVGTAQDWRFEVRTQNQGTFLRFKEVFEEQDIPIQLKRLYTLDNLIEGNQRSLSKKQRDTLIYAQQEGYYEKPRVVTQDEIAEYFGISRRSVAERLRRGTHNLIVDTLLPGEGPEST